MASSYRTGVRRQARNRTYVWTLLPLVL